MFNKMSGRKFLNAYLQQMSIPYVMMFDSVSRKEAFSAMHTQTRLNYRYQIGDKGQQRNIT